MFPSQILILFVVLINCVSVKCEENLFLIKKDNNFYCITNSSLPLTWISDDLESSITPKTTLNSSFGKDWTWRTSFGPKVILDRRWEDFQMHKTMKNKFVTIPLKVQKNFVIPFSLKIQRNANIFLCDSDSLYCYWFLLRVFDTNKTSAFKCHNQPVQELVHEHGCSKNLNKAKFSLTVDRNYLDERQWLHFQLERKNNIFSLTQIKENTTRPIISFKDKEEFVPLENIVLYSGNITGLWKLHEIGYVFSQNEVSNQQVGPPMEVAEGSLCVAMFVWMCPNCRIKLALSVPDGDILEELDWVEYDKQDWVEIRISLDKSPEKRVVLLVSTSLIDEEKSEEAFWGISAIGTCQEFRMINTTKPNAKCGLVSLENTKQEEVSNTIVFPNKMKNTIGIPCSWVSEEFCDKAKICFPSQERSICGFPGLPKKKEITSTEGITPKTSTITEPELDTSGDTETTSSTTTYPFTTIDTESRTVIQGSSMTENTETSTTTPSSSTIDTESRTFIQGSSITEDTEPSTTTTSSVVESRTLIAITEKSKISSGSITSETIKWVFYIPREVEIFMMILLVFAVLTIATVTVCVWTKFQGW